MFHRYPIAKPHHSVRATIRQLCWRLTQAPGIRRVYFVPTRSIGIAERGIVLYSAGKGRCPPRAELTRGRGRGGGGRGRGLGVAVFRFTFYDSLHITYILYTCLSLPLPILGYQLYCNLYCCLPLRRECRNHTYATSSLPLPSSPPSPSSSSCLSFQSLLPLLPSTLPAAVPLPCPSPWSVISSASVCSSSSPDTDLSHPPLSPRLFPLRPLRAPTFSLLLPSRSSALLSAYRKPSASLTAYACRLLALAPLSAGYSNSASASTEYPPHTLLLPSWSCPTYRTTLLPPRHTIRFTIPIVGAAPPINQAPIGLVLRGSFHTFGIAASGSPPPRPYTIRPVTPPLSSRTPIPSI